MLLRSRARASPRAPVKTAAFRSRTVAGTHSTAGILYIDLMGLGRLHEAEERNSGEQLDHPRFETNAHNLHSGKPLAAQQSSWPAQPHICGEHDLQGARMTDCNPHTHTHTHTHTPTDRHDAHSDPGFGGKVSRGLCTSRSTRSLLFVWTRESYGE